MTADYTVKKVSKTLVDDIKQSLREVDGWGSVEIFIQDHEVNQITVRKIRKTKPNGPSNNNGNKGFVKT